MTTGLVRTLPLAVFLLTAASGCELIRFDAPIEPPAPDDIEPGDGGGPRGPAPLYPFRPGSTWQYTVTALNGSTSLKYVSIDAKQVMVGGVGEHQLDMAYPVRTSAAPGGPASLITLQQAVGDQIVNWREETFEDFGQMVLDINFEPQQLEVDQSSERTRIGASWLDSYTSVIRPLGGVPSQIETAEKWTVVAHELLPLPGIATPFQTIVFQKSDVTTGTVPDAGGDAGRTGDAACVRDRSGGPCWKTIV